MAEFNIHFENAERYLKGLMWESEKLDYENSLQSDSQIRENHEAYLELINGLYAYDTTDLKNTINDVINQSTQQSKTRNMNTQKQNGGFLRIAAMVLVLAAAGFWLMNRNTKVDPQQVFAEHDNLESSQLSDALNRLGTAGFGKSVPADTTGYSEMTEEEILAQQMAEKRRKDTLVLALNQFKTSKWKNSRKTLFEYLEKFEEPVEDNTVARYHYAKACMNMSDYASAVQEYDKLLAGSVPQKMRWEAEFERALSYLQVNNDQAKGFFKKISEDMGHKYRDIADGMLTNL